MQITALSSVAAGPQPGQSAPKANTAEAVGEASRQFESILLRQFLSESMKPLLEGGPSGQIYGYMLTDSLADSMTKAGGMGLSSIIQTQLGKGIQ